MSCQGFDVFAHLGEKILDEKSKVQGEGHENIYGLMATRHTDLANQLRLAQKALFPRGGGFFFLTQLIGIFGGQKRNKNKLGEKTSKPEMT